MSKIGSVQSMAVLFSPESERNRAARKNQDTSASTQTFRVPGATKPKIDESSKSQDSLGNPSSPGYEGGGQKKKPGEEPLQEEARATAGRLAREEIPLRGHGGKALIRLQTGWDKMLLAQKKICEKAKNLFLTLDAPDQYQKSRKSKSLIQKSRGCIVDLDIETLRQEAESKAKRKKTEDAA